MELPEEFVGLRRIGDLTMLYGREVILSLAFLVAGLLAAKIAVKYLRRILDRFMTNKSMVATIANTTFVFLIVIVFVIVLEQAGWRSTVIHRILAGAALVIAAVIFLVRPLIPTLPFKVGNMVQLGGLLGKVETITLINTRLKSFDGRTYFIPNQKILSDTVVNYHFTPDRQIRLPVTIRYSDDLLKAKKILTEIMTADPKVKEKPAPKVYVVNLGDNGVELSARCWVDNPKYWTVRCALLEKTKLRFDQEGIVNAFPQRDVHLYGVTSDRKEQMEPHETETI
jgi:small conductance mechanosensitive channel